MDYSLLGFSVDGNSQAGILEQVAIPFSRLSSQLQDRALAGGYFITEPTGKLIYETYWFGIGQP